MVDYAPIWAAFNVYSYTFKGFHWDQWGSYHSKG